MATGTCGAFSGKFVKTRVIAFSAATEGMPIDPDCRPGVRVETLFITIVSTVATQVPALDGRQSARLPRER